MAQILADIIENVYKEQQAEQKKNTPIEIKRTFVAKYVFSLDACTVKHYIIEQYGITRALLEYPHVLDATIEEAGAWDLDDCTPTVDRLLYTLLLIEIMMERDFTIEDTETHESFKAKAKAFI
jgi:hypothetical protein